MDGCVQRQMRERRRTVDGNCARGRALIDDAAPPYDGEPPNKVLAWAMRAIIVICIAAAVRRRIKRRIMPNFFSKLAALATLDRSQSSCPC